MFFHTCLVISLLLDLAMGWCLNTWGKISISQWPMFQTEDKEKVICQEKCPLSNWNREIWEDQMRSIQATVFSKGNFTFPLVSVFSCVYNMRKRHPICTMHTTPIQLTKKPPPCFDDQIHCAIHYATHSCIIVSPPTDQARTFKMASMQPKHCSVWQWQSTFHT